jgi:hypothetical protein
MSESEVKETVTEWLNGLAIYYCDEGIIRLVHCLDKCLNCSGNHVEKKDMLYLILTLTLFE